MVHYLNHKNGTVWTPSQFEDLKFRMNRCKFTSDSGTLFLYAPTLQEAISSDDTNTYNTIEDPITTLPRKTYCGC